METGPISTPSLLKTLLTMSHKFFKIPAFFSGDLIMISFKDLDKLFEINERIGYNELIMSVMIQVMEYS